MLTHHQRFKILIHLFRNTMLLFICPIFMIAGCENADLEKLKNENVKLKSENARLRQEIESPKTDSPSSYQKTQRGNDIKNEAQVIQPTDLRVRPYIGKTVYLWYDGLTNTVHLWSKPGALALGASIIKTLSLSEGRIPCKLIAHKPLDSDRNYFLVRLQDGTEGWVGRPYVFKSETGYEHILPNPITGEP